MKCQQVKLHIEQFLDGELAVLRRDAVIDHVKNCVSCRAALENEKMLRQQLKNLPAKKINPTFMKKAMKRAHNSHKSVRHHFMPGFTAAVTASLAIWFLTTTTVMQTAIVTPSENENFPLIAMTVHETRTVNMMLNSPDDFNAVNFSLSLPDGFEISGYPGKKKLDWKVDIKKGSNTLALPLVALATGEGELVASIAYVNKFKSFRLRVSSEKTNPLVL